MLAYLPLVGDALQQVARGGPEIGTQTLVSFYTIHTTIVPVVLIVLMGFHFWRVRRAGGVVEPPPEAGEPEGGEAKRLFLPDLLLREVVQALVIVAAVVVLAALFGAPLAERANPGMSTNPAKAPWYFLGFQELLIHLHPVFAVLVFPLLAGVGFLLLPYLSSDDEPAGRWFLSATGQRTATLAAVAALVATPLLVIADEVMGGGPSGWFGGGVLPLALVAGAVAGSFVLARRRYGASVNEAVQAVVILLAVAFAVLTLIGVWFRGEGMTLVWPWQR